MHFLLFLLLFFSELFALTLNSDVEKLDSFSLEYYYDKNSSHTIDDINTSLFTRVNNQFTFGYLPGDVWFKLRVENRGNNENFILYFTEPLWEKFDLYTFLDNRWQVKHAGLLTPLHKREIFDVNPAFHLHIESNQEKTYYINAKTVSGQVGEFQLFSEREYFKPFRFSITNNYIIYIAMLSVVLILNLYLLFKRRERIYFYYVMYLIAFIVWISVVSGIYLLFGFPPWNEALHVTGTWVVLLLALFSLEFLELKEHNPAMFRIFTVFIGLFALFGILIALKIPYSSLLFNVVSSIFFVLLLFISIKVYLSNTLKMRYYLLALIIYMPTMALMTMNFNHIIENNDITRYAFVFGSMIEVLFFNSLMINRYHKSAIDANIDPLSKIYNRRYFLNEADKTFDEAKRYGYELSIVMIDIDNFKNVNDTFGHVCGDKVISYCADTLKHTFRSSDTVARYGGEEFIVLTKRMNSKDVYAIAERIRENIQGHKLYNKNSQEILFTISIGITSLLVEDATIYDVINRADKALYQAKSNGKNQVSFV